MFFSKKNKNLRHFKSISVWVWCVDFGRKEFGIYLLCARSPWQKSSLVLRRNIKMGAKWLQVHAQLNCIQCFLDSHSVANTMGPIFS